MHPIPKTSPITLAREGESLIPICRATTLCTNDFYHAYAEESWSSASDLAPFIHELENFTVNPKPMPKIQPPPSSNTMVTPLDRLFLIPHNSTNPKLTLSSSTRDYLTGLAKLRSAIEDNPQKYLNALAAMNYEQSRDIERLVFHDDAEFYSARMNEVTNFQEPSDQQLVELTVRGIEREGVFNSLIRYAYESTDGSQSPKDPNSKQKQQIDLPKVSLPAGEYINREQAPEGSLSLSFIVSPKERGSVVLTKEQRRDLLLRNGLRFFSEDQALQSRINSESLEILISTLHDKNRSKEAALIILRENLRGSSDHNTYSNIFTYTAPVKLKKFEKLFGDDWNQLSTLEKKYISKRPIPAVLDEFLKQNKF